MLTVSVVEVGALIAAITGLTTAVVLVGRKLGAIETVVRLYFGKRETYEGRHVQHMRRMERYEQVKLAMAGAEPKSWRDTGPITLIAADGDDDGSDVFHRGPGMKAE